MEQEVSRGMETLKELESSRHTLEQTNEEYSSQPLIGLRRFTARTHWHREETASQNGSSRCEGAGLQLGAPSSRPSPVVFVHHGWALTAQGFVQGAFSLFMLVVLYIFWKRVRKALGLKRKHSVSAHEGHIEVVPVEELEEQPSAESVTDVQIVEEIMRGMDGAFDEMDVDGNMSGEQDVREEVASPIDARVRDEL
eukprot:scaffold4020_cov391-Prasinococcus_capsulatus_cf.AAC.2